MSQYSEAIGRAELLDMLSDNLNRLPGTDRAILALKYGSKARPTDLFHVFRQLPDNSLRYAACDVARRLATAEILDWGDQSGAAGEIEACKKLLVLLPGDKRNRILQVLRRGIQEEPGDLTIDDGRDPEDWWKP